LLLLVATAALLSACDLGATTTPTAPGEPTATSGPQIEPTPPPTSAIDPTPTVPPSLTLRIWSIESFSPTETITSGQILLEQVTAFQNLHADVRIDFQIKKPYGKGGILDYLLTTEAVVPTLLPDLVYLDIEELGAAVQAEVVQPLDNLIPADLASDLFPFARQAGTLNGQLYGVQVQADLDHLVYNTGQLTVPPRSWPGVLSSPRPYLFPAGGQAGLVNDDFLVQLLGVRPWPSAEDPEAPFLEVDSVTAVLQYYQDGVSRGVFPPQILDYHTTEDSWRDYLAGQAALTHVSAHRYLLERDQLPDSAMAPIPGIGGATNPLSRGWALALVTADPARQSLAIEFLSELMSPQTNAAWNEAASFLPTRQAAMATWNEEDSYARFAEQQLQAAQPRPRVPGYTQVAAALQQAVEQVITGITTPEEAAKQVVGEVE
jgi:ABC-type glycerol-3-phosphate transport system substrate-binding protein